MKAIVLSLVVAATAASASADEIPIKTIWGLNIGGTSNVKDLVPPPKKNPDSAEDFVKSSPVEQVAQLLGQRHAPSEGKKAGDGFLVAGVGREALENACKVFAGKERPLKEVQAGKPYSLVLFAYASGRSFCLDKISVSDGEVNVDYHLNAHELMSSSAHFALVPLPDLKPGKMAVTMKRSLDTGPEAIVARLAKIPAEKLVNASFSINVTDVAR